MLCCVGATPAGPPQVNADRLAASTAVADAPAPSTAGAARSAAGEAPAVMAAAPRHEPSSASITPPHQPARLVQHEDPANPRIAIIIDDLGYNLRRGIDAANLPGALTLAVLPQSPNGVALAELGHERGKEIILHTPMSTIGEHRLDSGGLSGTMSRQEFEQVLQHNLRSIPHISGLNNHMGSQLTQQPEPMQWLMTILARKELFFIDSRTSAGSIAFQTALQTLVPARKRDVFLDNERNLDSIQRQLEKLIQLAHRRGSAIAIGHPYPETLEALNRALPTLTQQGVTLVPVSQLLPTLAVNGITQTHSEPNLKATIQTASQTSTPQLSLPLKAAKPTTDRSESGTPQRLTDSPPER
ncbi:divergent polysaccharide deacetylase family protein [Aestuariicella hydrocarbonica]|uniref:Divergent polysaccharide deacetylase family protein n=1 Tax=Pseudomaricurvus hydrocarbonicus TaxID=1470433 RepID=A0A9E5MNR0_9GAMM|nr:divergent polysaccharide deacetylase family protein [Aestuariicella hydrocarbonica]NHO67567.1 divergent polysaccharide deacetylase family protein [Aestuariicella hydrocarbonica]